MPLSKMTAHNLHGNAPEGHAGKAEPIPARDLDRFASKAERAAATALINELRNCGYLISVHDGEDWACRHTTDRKTALDAMASTGTDTVHAYKRNKTELHCVMHFSLIYQDADERDEVIYDYGSRSDYREEADRIWNIAAGRAA